jgi:hypothetical protein
MNGDKKSGCIDEDGVADVRRDSSGFPITSDYPADRLDFNRDSIKHDFRSPNYTTKWSDIP